MISIILLAFQIYRKIFNLPCPSSLTNWLSCVNAEPGFFKEVFDAMRTFREADTDCALIVDGMSIRKQLNWDTKTQKYVGVCDYGEEINLEAKDTEATEALVMMVVGLRNRWKWPIGKRYQFFKREYFVLFCFLILFTRQRYFSCLPPEIEKFNCCGWRKIFTNRVLFIRL